MHSLVIIPTYDEAATIRTVLDRVLDAVPSTAVLVVDDNSPDDTAGVVRRHPAYGAGVHLLSRTGKQGLGSAYRAGFAWAAGHGYDAVVEMDADLSHPPEVLPQLLEGLARADLVIGSRYVPGGGTRNWPWRRRALSRGGNLYVRLVLGLPVADATAGFRAFRTETLDRIGALDSQSNGYCFQIETTWRTDRAGLRIAEVPIVFTDRALGVSKMDSGIAREAVLRVLAWRWAELTRRSPQVVGASR